MTKLYVTVTDKAALQWNYIMTTSPTPCLECWKEQVHILNNWIEHLIPNAPKGVLLIQKMQVQDDTLILYADTEFTGIIPALEAKLIAFQSAIFNAQAIPLVKIKCCEGKTDE